MKTEVGHLKAQSDDVSRRLKQTVEANTRLRAETAQLQNALNAQCNQAAAAMEQNVTLWHLQHGTDFQRSRMR